MAELLNPHTFRVYLGGAMNPITQPIFMQLVASRWRFTVEGEGPYTELVVDMQDPAEAERARETMEALGDLWGR